MAGNMLYAISYRLNAISNTKELKLPFHMSVAFDGVSSMVSFFLLYEPPNMYATMFTTDGKMQDISYNCNRSLPVRYFSDIGRCRAEY